MIIIYFFWVALGQNIYLVAVVLYSHLFFFIFTAKVDNKIFWNQAGVELLTI